MMSTCRCLVLVLLLVSVIATTAFTTKKLDPRTHPRPSFKSTAGGAAVAPKESKDHHHHHHHHHHDATPTPVPAFTRTNTATAASMSPAVYMEDEDDDDELFGYGTALVSCVLSLALGFTLGYGT